MGLLLREGRGKEWGGKGKEREAKGWGKGREG